MVMDFMELLVRYLNNMKFSLLLFLVICTIACDSSENGESQVKYAIPELTLTEGDARLSLTHDGILYLDSTKFSGYLLSYYQDSTVKTNKSYYNGKLEGDFISYHPGGQVYAIRPYHLGEKHGEHLGYYSEGQLKFRYFFVDGFGQGTHKEWYQNGDLRSEMNYKDGKEFGSQKVWRPDGKMRSNYVVRENGRQYGMLGLKRCAKIDSETGDVDPYKGNIK